MDVAVDLTTGIWVEAVATVGVGAVGVVMVDTGWARNLTLYPLLVIMALFFFHLPWVLGPFSSWGWCLVGLVMAGFVVAGLVADVSGVGAWVWDQAFLLTLNTFSSFG